MKKIIPFLLVAVLTACGQSDGPQKSAGSAANIHHFVIGCYS